MLRFKVNINRVTPILIKYFGPIHWYWQDIDEKYCYLNYEWDSLGFNTLDEAEKSLTKLRSLLTLPITFDRKKVDLNPEFQEELLFLILYIKDIIHSTLNHDATDYIYEELVENYIKVKAYIKQFQIENPSANPNSTGLVLEVKPQGRSKGATFNNLDVYYNFNHFLKAIEQQINIYIPEKVRKELSDPNLSLSRARELQKSQGVSKIYDDTKFIKAKATLMLQEYLRTIPPFIQESTEPGLDLTNDQIRLIYPLYHAIGWEEKADKKEAYIKTFRKRIIHYYDKVIDSLKAH